LGGCAAQPPHIDLSSVEERNTRPDAPFLSRGTQI
jgi:hypothetical protein